MLKSIDVFLVLQRMDIQWTWGTIQSSDAIYWIKWHSQPRHVEKSQKLPPFRNRGNNCKISTLAQLFDQFFVGSITPPRFFSELLREKWRMLWILDFGYFANSKDHCSTRQIIYDHIWTFKAGWKQLWYEQLISILMKFLDFGIKMKRSFAE